MIASYGPVTIRRGEGGGGGGLVHFNFLYIISRGPALATAY